MATHFNWGHPEVDASPDQSRFEEERVKMLLGEFGLGDLKWELLDAHAAAYRTRRLTFAGLRTRVPDLPVLLEARHVGGVSERVRPAALFRKFARTLLTDLYLEVYARHAEEAGDRPVGLVVPFDGFRSGMVVHNGAFDTGSTRLVHPVPGGAPPHRLTAEPYAAFLRYVSRGGWTPGGKSGAQLPTARPEPELAAAVAPWMVRLLGSGPAVIVLGWLYAVLASDAARDRKWVRRTDGGERYVSATREEIAAATGLSPDAVKRGLTILKEKELVLTFRGDHTTNIVVVPQDECGW